MELETNIQKLKYYINESINSKENILAIKKKEYSQQNLEMRKRNLTILERQVEMEEDLSNDMMKAEKHLQMLSLKMDLENQIELNKSKLEEERAEGLIESLSAKSKDRQFFNELKKNEKVTDEEFEKYNEHRNEYLKLKTKRDEERDAINHAANERRNLLREFQKEFENQKSERRKLEKQGIEIDLGFSLQGKYLKKEELKNLREEEQSLEKEKENKKERKRKSEEKKLQEQNVLKGREEQLRLKEESHFLEDEREKKYALLLTELLAEEEGLHRLRSEVASRKRKEHFVIAQKILEERKRRRKELNLERDRRFRDEKELSALRDSISEEEEKQLLLHYLPHLGPFLSSYVLEKLARL